MEFSKLVIDLANGWAVSYDVQTDERKNLFVSAAECRRAYGTTD